MGTYKLTVIQEFECEYVVEADSAEEAQEALMFGGDGECIDQNPSVVIDVLSVEDAQ